MFKAVRTVYFENDKRKVTEKKYETYKRAKAYAKRYSKLVNGARFVEVEVKFDTDSFKFRNVDIFVADSNGFENEHLEEIEKFQKETEEPKKPTKQDTEYLVKGNNDYEYETTNLKEAKRVLYRESRNNPDVHFGLIELNADGSWKQVLVEGTMNVEEQHERIVNFIFDGETVYEIDEYVAVFDTEEEAREAAKKVAKSTNQDIKIYKNGKKIVDSEVEEQNVKYTVSRFACSPEKNFDTVDEARLFAKECAKNYGFVYTVNKVQGTTARVIEEIKPQKSEKRYNFYVKDYTEKRDVPIVYSDYTKKEIIKEVQGWADKNNHVYKIFIADKTSDKALAGRVFFKVINWKPIFKVGRTNSRLQFGEFTYEEAEAYCKEYARKDSVAYTIYKVELDKFGRDEFAPIVTIANIEPPKQPTHYELMVNEYDENGNITKENEAKFKTLEEASSCADELIHNVEENDIKLKLYKVTGEDFECLFTKHASRIHGLVAIAEDKPVQTVAETPAEYVTDSELISMLVKEPVSASLYDFMREPQKVKISKKGRKRLNAVREIVKRALVALPEEKTMIGTVEDAANLMMKRLRYKNKECFYAIILDTKNKVVNISKITEGYLNGSIVHPTDVFKEILRYETACSVIFCHNHPSGDPTPSTEDINITFRLVKAGKVLDIEVLDHIIIGDGIYKSFKKDGLLNNNATSLPWLESEGR